MSHKSWAYTLNNYTDQDINQLKALECTRHRSCKELGESGTPHLQGTITFGKSTRLTALRKLNPRIHWEPCKSLEASINYCTKGEIIIDTNNCEQGRRSDLTNAIDSLKKNLNMYDVVEDHPEVFVKCHKGLEKLQQKLLLKKCPKFFVTEVHVLWGASRTGKSRWCRERHPNLYNVPEPINQSLWFDNYDGEEAILLDDFYGWVKYHTLLQLTDGYPMQLPVKGGFVVRMWTTVYITSNKPVEEWYPNVEDISALKNRITSIQHLTAGCDL